MRFKIDQSGKVEDTAKLTIVACANGLVKTLKISAAEKRQLVTLMKSQSKSKTFIYKIFAGLVFLLVKGEKADELLIDKEYPGHEATIKQIILQQFEKNKIETPEINFSLITKKSLVHKIAIETYRGKRKADLVVRKEDVLKLFPKKSWRSR